MEKVEKERIEDEGKKQVEEGKGMEMNKRTGGNVKDRR